MTRASPTSKENIQLSQAEQSAAIAAAQLEIQRRKTQSKDDEIAALKKRVKELEKELESEKQKALDDVEAMRDRYGWSS